MKKFVDIIGVDQQQTKLIGNISSNNSDRGAALVVGAKDCRLSKLSLTQNKATKNVCIGIYNNHSTLELSEITLTISNTNTIQYGLFNNCSSLSLSEVNIYLEQTSQDQYVIFNSQSCVSLKKSLLQASNGQEYVYGIYNYASSVILHNCIVNLQQGKYQYGVYNKLANSFATIENCRIFAETASLVTPSKPSHAQTYFAQFNY